MAEIGAKIADRWVNLLVLPGLLWTAALAAGLRLGQEDPFDVVRLRVWLDQIAAQRASHDLAAVLLAGAAILLASAAAGLAASALGGVLQWLWALPGDLPPAAWLLHRRQQRWDRATTVLKTAVARAAHPEVHHLGPAGAARRARRAHRRRDRLGLTRPIRPTWVGDRFYATGRRVRDHNGLDLDLVWPRLWSVLPDTLRSDLAAAHDAYTTAARTAAWGVLYLALAVAWWPAALVGLAVLLAAAVRARSSADVLACLVETAVDLHAKDLAAAVGLPPMSEIAGLGRAVSERLSAVPPPRHLSGADVPTPLPGTAPTPPPAA